MKKSELRAKYKALRSELSENDIEEQSMAIANRLLALPIWDFQYYHLFLSIEEQKEVNTEAILHILQGKDKHVIIPKTDVENDRLVNILLTDNTVLRKNKWGIPEPVEGIEIPAPSIQVVFIPLLAFDSHGNRIGYGKGYYDKFLAGCSDYVVKVGLSFFEAETAIKDLYTSDIPLDYCITPNTSYRFKK